MLLDEALEDLKAAFAPEQREFWDTDDWKSDAEDCSNGGELELVARKYSKIVVPFLSQEFKKVDPKERKKGLAQLEEDLSGASQGRRQ